MIKAEKNRVIGFAAFFVGLTVLLFGVLVSMYYGSAWGVIASLVIAGAAFIVTLVFGGRGWSTFAEPTERHVFTPETRSQGSSATTSTATASGEHLVRGYGAMNPEEPPLHEGRGVESVDEDAGVVELHEDRHLRGYGAMSPDEPPLGSRSETDTRPEDRR